jgi:hypothetical protein
VHVPQSTIVGDHRHVEADHDRLAAALRQFPREARQVVVGVDTAGELDAEPGELR